ncbi:MAG: hypothetical protein IPM54_42125 [Polyangiaceae bacterium]|nr:hypothetical protein [Polyangiaceae bacterium]
MHSAQHRRPRVFDDSIPGTLGRVNDAEHELDCGLLADGFTCQTVNGTSFCGLASECYDLKPACEGDSVVLCNAGRIDKIDCKSLGFTGCNAMWGTCSPSIYDEFGP